MDKRLEQAVSGAAKWTGCVPFRRKMLTRLLTYESQMDVWRVLVRCVLWVLVIDGAKRRPWGLRSLPRGFPLRSSTPRSHVLAQTLPGSATGAKPLLRPPQSPSRNDRKPAGR
jgi:hypothetical protein